MNCIREENILLAESMIPNKGNKQKGEREGEREREQTFNKLTAGCVDAFGLSVLANCVYTFEAQQHSTLIFASF